MDLNDENESYYIRMRGRVLGPYDLEQLKILRGRGQFGRANESSTDRESWQSAATIEHLFSDSATSKKKRRTSETTEVSAGPPSRSMAPCWHYAVGDEQCGPVTLLDLRGLIAGKQLMLDDLVWKEGMSDWIPIRDVAELSAIAKASDSAPTSQSNITVIGSQHFCFACGSPTDARAEVCPKCGVRQPEHSASSKKNRMTAALFALLIGGTGAHHFYLGNTLQGVMYLLFCWTFIPAIVALIEGIIFLCMSDASFYQKYGNR